MREKSKFIIFLLSFIPGLSHFYLGFKDRAVVFLMVFFGTILGTVGLSAMTNSNFVMLLLFALPVIWLIALIDAFSLRKKFIFNENGEPSGIITDENMEEIMQSNKRTITMALSIIPGAGHMYLGYQKKGLIIMGGFFFTVFFMGWLGVSLFLFILPLIWFYSFFDALHSVDGVDFEDEEIKFVLPEIKPEWIGIGLIVIGVLVVTERILYPLIPYEIRNYIQTSIVSIIFIAGGIRLLSKSKKAEKKEEDEEKWKKDE